MTKAETKAHWAIPDKTLGDGCTLTHKREREAYVKGYHQAIEDACEYLRDHIDKDLTIYHEQTWCKLDEFINRLKKVMEK